MKNKNLNTMEGGAEWFNRVRERCANCLNIGVEGYNQMFDESVEVDGVDESVETEPAIRHRQRFTVPDPEPEPEPAEINITPNEIRIAENRLMNIRGFAGLDDSKYLEIKKHYNALRIVPFSVIYDEKIDPNGEDLDDVRKYGEKTSHRELRKKKITLAKEEHPDKQKEERSNKQNRMAEINTAYDYLIDQNNPFHKRHEEHTQESPIYDEPEEQTAEDRERAEAAAEERAERVRASEPEPEPSGNKNKNKKTKKSGFWCCAAPGSAKLKAKNNKKKQTKRRRKKATKIKNKNTKKYHRKKEKNNKR